MHHRVVEVQEEGLAGVRAALEEPLGALHVLRIDEAPHLDSQLLEFPGRLALDGLQDLRHRIAARAVPRIVGPQRFVVRARDAVPLVEPVVGRKPAR
jgi:hypothetical protein